MATKHMVIDKNGKVHKRVSQNRSYSHAVVIHFPTVPANGNYLEWPAHTKTEWASRRELAKKVAGSYRSRGYEVEVLVANHV